MRRPRAPTATGRRRAHANTASAPVGARRAASAASRGPTATRRRRAHANAASAPVGARRAASAASRGPTATRRRRVHANTAPAPVGAHRAPLPPLAHDRAAACADRERPPRQGDDACARTPRACAVPRVGAQGLRPVGGRPRRPRTARSVLVRRRPVPYGPAEEFSRRARQGGGGVALRPRWSRPNDALREKNRPASHELPHPLHAARRSDLVRHRPVPGGPAEESWRRARQGCGGVALRPRWSRPNDALRQENRPANGQLSHPLDAAPRATTFTATAIVRPFRRGRGRVGGGGPSARTAGAGGRAGRRAPIGRPGPRPRAGLRG